MNDAGVDFNVDQGEDGLIRGDAKEGRISPGSEFVVGERPVIGWGFRL